MKRSIATGLVFGLSLIVAMPTFAASKKDATAQIMKKPKRTTGGGILVPSGGAIALTAAECTGLGGTVGVNVNCDHDACYTVDPVGVIRKVCLSAAK